MRCFLLLGTLVVLASCQTKSCKDRFDEKVLDLAQADSSKLFKVSDVAKITSWVASYAIQNPKFTMPQMGDGIMAFAKRNYSKFLPIGKLIGYIAMYDRCARCLKKFSSNVFDIAERMSPAMYTALKEPYAKCQKKLNTGIKAKKTEDKLTEDLFCVALTFATPKTLKGFVKPAKCNVRCEEMDCAKEALDKLSKFSKYDDAKFPCGKCVKA